MQSEALNDTWKISSPGVMISIIGEVERHVPGSSEIITYPEGMVDMVKFEG
jgi:hypothetical protein